MGYASLTHPTFAGAYWLTLGKTENADITQVFAGFAALGIIGGAAAAIAYWIFQTFAKGWLGSRFQHDLEMFKTQNTREIERLKSDLSRYADRATKFHTREYEVLPEAWGMMNKA